jgi:hypothetical protein
LRLRIFITLANLRHLFHIYPSRQFVLGLHGIIRHSSSAPSSNYKKTSTTYRQAVMQHSRVSIHSASQAFDNPRLHTTHDQLLTQTPIIHHHYPHSPATKSRFGPTQHCPSTCLSHAHNVTLISFSLTPKSVSTRFRRDKSTSKSIYPETTIPQIEDTSKKRHSCSST